MLPCPEVGERKRERERSITKSLPLLIGPDAAPVILPLQQFGNEHHWKLSSLPQIPQLASSPSSRLLMSFWDREVGIWRVSRGPVSEFDRLEGQRYRLVAKVLLQVSKSLYYSSLLAPF